METNIYFTCRLKGKDLMVDNDVMKKVCGFTFSGTRSKALDFDAKKSWAELSPHTTWDSVGMSNGLIEDLPLPLCIGSSATMLPAKRRRIKSEIALTRRGLPALGHFVTALANHFDITPEAYRLHGEIALQERSEMRCLNYNELKQADLIRNQTTAKEYTKRTAYDTYFKKLQ
ncbi:ribonuclease 2 [Striga asiatica]|uniref:Ribonuclease 2 n=1 Tax=Striga asiatica TaxID=4170 RepID=A0A5A7PTV4_STRAF|nr:ribonuclease 2 [Striga asiatica]